MVKGVSKRVVVVQLSGLHLFEQAILLMRDGCDEQGVTEQQILQEANQIAAQYQNEQGGFYLARAHVPRRSRMSWAAKAMCAILGGGLASAIWLLVA